MLCESCGSSRLRVYLVNTDDRTLRRYRCRDCGYDDYAD